MTILPIWWSLQFLQCPPKHVMPTLLADVHAMCSVQLKGWGILKIRDLQQAHS